MALTEKERKTYNKLHYKKNREKILKRLRLNYKKKHDNK